LRTGALYGKRKIFEHISLDGVIQSSGEDDFLYGDWTARYVVGLLAEIAAQSCGRRINAATGYVVTHRPESLASGLVIGVGANVIAELRRIKSQGRT
jgi:hypothetical protein